MGNQSKLKQPSVVGFDKAEETNQQRELRKWVRLLVVSWSVSEHIVLHLHDVSSELKVANNF